MSNIEQFRSLCLKHLQIVDSYSLPKIEKVSNKSIVIVETRILPHLKLTIKTLLRHIEDGWSMYFFTGKASFPYWKKVCSAISENIVVINLGIKSLSSDQYSSLFLDANFWEEIHSEKILIFQEDALSFRKGIKTFMKYDYIGAPWIKEFKVSKTHIGNGGVSLRSKKAMLDAIEQYRSEDFKLSEKTLAVMKVQNQSITPEDVFFSNAFYQMKKKIPSYQKSKEFSLESLFHENPLFCHQIWRYEKTESQNTIRWKEFLFKNLFTPLENGELP